MVFKAILTLFQLFHSCKYTYPCFPGVFCTSAQHNILSKRRMNPVANWLASIFGKEIGPAADQTCTQVETTNRDIGTHYKRNYWQAS